MPPLRRVFLDPDGTVSQLFGVIIRHPTGVRFEHQCGGVETLTFGAEGYFVPLTAPPEALAEELTAVFHHRGGCLWRGNPAKHPPHGCHLAPERLARLKQLVAAIPYWTCDAADTETRTFLALDEAQLGDLVEAWVPVITEDGPAILIWENCD